MTYKSIFIAFLVALVGFGGGYLSHDKKPAAPTQMEESVFDRVMRTKVLRCGYVVYPPIYMKDPNTGKATGIFHDLTEEIAKVMGVKVEWTQEASFATYNEDLRMGRYDAFCSGVWPLAERAEVETYSNPVFYSGVGIWVRKDDKRFTDVDQVNNEAVTIAAIDGEMAGLIASQSFPKAKILSLPASTDQASMLLNVTTGKADVALVDVSTANSFLSHNPDSVRNLVPNDPIRFFPSVYGFKLGEFKIKSAFDTAIQDFLNNGLIGNLLNKYEEHPHSLYRVAKPYRNHD